MKKRLKKSDWVTYGLVALTRSGFKSLRAEPLANGLGVSRGSFYWHFKDIADYEQEVMQAWQHRSTEMVIADMEQKVSAENRLRALVELTLSSDLKLDKAMRSWSLEDQRARKIVAEVDAQRIAYVESLVAEIIGDDPDVALKARLIYCSAIGMSVVGMRNRNSKKLLQEVDRILKQFISEWGA